jgi:hypothetical protein
MLLTRLRLEGDEGVKQEWSADPAAITANSSILVFEIPYPASSRIAPGLKYGISWAALKHAPGTVDSSFRIPL